MSRPTLSDRSPEAPRRRGALVGATAGIDRESGRPASVIDVLDLDASTPEVARIPLAFPAHGLALHPRRRCLAAAIEKRGAGAAVVDLVEGRCLHSLAPLPDHSFSGHAAWSAEGEVLFVVETHLRTGAGALSVRDADTLAVLERLSTRGFSPHDCRPALDGRLAVTNGGGTAASGRRPSLVLIDPATDDLVDRRELDDPRRNAGHVALAADGALAVVSAPRDGLPERTAPGGVAVALTDGPLACLTEPTRALEALVGEALSVVIHTPSRTVVVTHPYAGLVSFWNLKRGFLGTLAAPAPRGVAIFGKGQEVVVSCGAVGRLLLVDPLARSARPLEDAPEGVFGGAHLEAWDPTPAVAPRAP
jgi:uncharacterized protein